MGSSVEVDRSNFMTDVVEASHQRPVLVDFYAQWCGPCQMLKPMLEKLVTEYDFVLAKVDIDRNPDLASTYHVEGVPDVRVVQQGQMYSGFVGVLPEPQLRELLSKLNLKSKADLGLEAARAVLATGDRQKIKAVFAQLLEQHPHDRKIAIAYAKFLIQQDELAAAEGLLASIEPNEREFYAQAEALGHLIQLTLESEKPPEHELDPAFFAAIEQIVAEDYEMALQGLLAIVSTDRTYRSDGARKTMLLIFTLLGDDHPLTKHYRKQLTLTLY
jgi:putative thioredoxin